MNINNLSNAISVFAQLSEELSAPDLDDSILPDDINNLSNDPFNDTVDDLLSQINSLPASQKDELLSKLNNDASNDLDSLSDDLSDDLSIDSDSLSDDPIFSSDLDLSSISSISDEDSPPDPSSFDGDNLSTSFDDDF